MKSILPYLIYFHDYLFQLALCHFVPLCSPEVPGVISELLKWERMPWAIKRTKFPSRSWCKVCDIIPSNIWHFRLCVLIGLFLFKNDAPSNTSPFVLPSRWNNWSGMRFCKSPEEVRSRWGQVPGPQHETGLRRSSSDVTFELKWGGWMERRTEHAEHCACMVFLVITIIQTFFIFE